MWFSLPYFRSDPKFGNPLPVTKYLYIRDGYHESITQNSIPNFKPGLAPHSQSMMRAATQENAFGLYDTQSSLLNGVF